MTKLHFDRSLLWAVILLIGAVPVALCLTPLSTLAAASVSVALITLKLWPRSRVYGAHGILLGATTVLLPAAGHEALLCVVIVFLLLERQSSFEGSVWKPWLPFLILCVAWVIGEAAAGTDVETLKLLWSGNVPGNGTRGLQALYDWFRNNGLPWPRAEASLLRYAALVGITASLIKNTTLRRRVLLGIALGLTLSLPVTVFQILLLKEHVSLANYFPNQNDYWTRIGRIPSMFSDPNAFGVSIMLILPLLLSDALQLKGAKRALSIALAAAWLFLALYSGSRSFVLGIVLVATFALFNLHRKLFFSAALMAAIFVATVNYFPASTQTLSGASMPESVRRIAQTLQFSDLRQNIFSRTLFWRAALVLISKSPALGIGLEQFRDFVTPLIADIPGVIPLWSDNANNFYLGVAAELGLVGLAALLFALFSIRFRPDSPPLLRAAAFAFLIVLLLGPHLAFDEVMVLAAILLASIATFKTDTRVWPLLAGTILIAPFIFLKAVFGQVGFYGWERGGGGGEQYFRWTSRRAQGWITCKPEGGAELLIRAARPPRAGRTISAEIVPAGEPPRDITLQGDTLESVILPCEASKVPAIIRYSITVKKPWIPQRVGAGKDKRVLGVQVVTFNPGSTLP